MKTAAVAVAVVALAAWAGVQQVQLRNARQLAHDALISAEEAQVRAGKAQMAGDNAQLDATQANEDNVADKDVSGALIYCLRNDQQLHFGGMETCIDWWFNKYAEGDF